MLVVVGHQRECRQRMERALRGHNLPGFASQAADRVGRQRIGDTAAPPRLNRVLLKIHAGDQQQCRWRAVGRARAPVRPRPSGLGRLAGHGGNRCGIRGGSAFGSRPTPPEPRLRPARNLRAQQDAVVAVMILGNSAGSWPMMMQVGCRAGGVGGEVGQIACNASALVTGRPRAPYSCRSPNISMRMDWSRPPTRTGS